MRYLLGFFFLMIYAGDKLGLNVSFAPGLSSKNLLIYLTFAGIAVNVAVTRNRKFELPEIWIAFVLLIFYAILTWVFAAFIFENPDYEPLSTFVVLKSSLIDQFLTFFVFFFAIIKLKDAKSLLRTIVWITILGNIVTLIDTFDVPNLGILENAGRKAGRFDGFIGQPNLYGQILVLFMGPTIALWATESGKGRWLAAIGIFSAFIALVMTGSRGSYTGLIAGSLLAAFLLRRTIPTQAIVRSVVAATVLIAVAIFVTVVTGYSDVYLNTFDKFDGGTHMATSGRSTLWTNAIKAMVDNPLSFVTGHGFDAYDHSRNFYKATHNTYLTYLFNLGAIGLFLYVFVFARILATARLAIYEAPAEFRPHLIALVFGLSGFLVAIFFSEYHTSAYLLWAFLGVGMRIAIEMMKTSAFASDKELATKPILQA